MSRISPAFADLTGKQAIVTGSSSGIGRAIALELARGGADVIVHYARNLPGAEETADQIRQLGRTAHLFQADLSQSHEQHQLAKSCFELFPSAEIWVNNAGVDLLTGAAKEWSYAEKLQKLLEIDVTATVTLSKLAGEHFRNQNRGVILNIGWDQAERGMGGDSGELFATAKNAVMGFSRSLAVSLAPEVRVNCIAPGWIKTAWGENVGDLWQQRVLEETPLKCWGLPEDIARLARFLASPDASYLTGQVVYANGGAER